MKLRNIVSIVRARASAVASKARARPSVTSLSEFSSFADGPRAAVPGRQNRFAAGPPFEQAADKLGGQGTERAAEHNHLDIFHRVAHVAPGQRILQGAKMDQRDNTGRQRKAKEE